MSMEDKLQTDELSNVINSHLTWSIEDKQREVLESKIDDIICGFSVPYVRTIYRR
jgi:hypothetical protein